MTLNLKDFPYQIYSSATQGQQPGPVTGGVVSFNTYLQTTIADNTADRILGAWKVPFDFYVEDISWATTSVGSGVFALELAKNATPAIDGAEVNIIGGTGSSIDVNADSLGRLGDTPATPLYIKHKEAHVTAGAWLIVYITTPNAGGAGSIDSLSVIVTGFPYSHVYDYPADDRP